jgi:hypothetical protein
MPATKTNRYATVFRWVATHKANGAEREYADWLADFSKGKKKSLSDLSDSELKAFENYLSDPIETNNMEHDKLRKAIISQFLSIGRNAGYAISWAENHGTQKDKKRFNLYTKKELALMLAMAKKIKLQYEDKVWKETNNC